MANFDLDLTDNLDANIELDDDTENFKVGFGEVYGIPENDFNKLENRPSYAGQTMTGDTNIPAVPTKTSDLENDSDYQTGSEVESAISEAVAGKQDTLTAGDNITIENNVISATDTTYSAGNGLSLSNENAFSIDTTVVATQQNLATEVTNRENADINLQGQIDAIAASSDVVDIVGTYAELQSYDTQHLKDNDIIKVLQDETQNDATTYYRWSTATQSFTLIGQEGPYYTKAAADAQFVPQTRTVNSKALSSNITLTASDVSAVATGDIVQVTGSNTTKIMSQKATTDALGLKLNISDYVVDNALADSTNPVQNKVLYGLLGSMPSDFFTGPVTVNGNGRDITLTGTMNAKLSDVKMYGDTTQQTYSGKNKLECTLASLKSANTSGTWTDNVYVSNGITYTVNDDLTVTASGSTAVNVPSHFVINSAISLTPGTEYILSGSPSGGSAASYSMRMYDGGVYVSDTGSGISFTYGTQSIVRINIAGNINIGTKLFSPMIRLATVTDASYEPYVGGTASPNPDYPQDVNVVTGEQTVGVTGKNLFNPALFDGIITGTNGGYVTTKYYTGSTAVTLKLNPNTDYTLSLRNTNGELNGTGWSPEIDGVWKNIGNGSIKITTGETGEISLKLGAASWPAIGGYERTIQLEQGSTATTYEPYQGASYDVHLTSKNLLKNDMVDTTKYGVTATRNSDGSVTLTGTCDIPSGRAYFILQPNTFKIPAGTYTLSGGVNSGIVMYNDTFGVVQSSTTKTLTGPSSGNWSIGVASGVETNVTIYPQLEKGSSATSYQQYYDYELTKIGAYQDYIYKSGDDWYVHKEIGKITLDGSETWTWNQYNVSVPNYARTTSYTLPAQTANNVRCSHFIPINSSASIVDSINSIRILTNQIDLDFTLSTQPADLAAVKTWLGNNKPNLYYALATATDTQITNADLISDLNALWNALSYDGQTNFAITASGLSGILDVTAYKKTLAGMIGAINRS